MRAVVSPGLGFRVDLGKSSACLIGFLLATAYWPWITGAATTPRWLVLVGLLMVSIFVASKAVEKIDTAGLLGLAFVFWALLTAAWSPVPEWWDAAWKLLLLAGLYAVGTRIADLRPLLIGCAAGVGISSAIVVLERLGLLASQGAPSGLFVNGLYLAEFAAMVVAGLLAYRLWWWALLCAPALLLVITPRGPLLALAFVAMGSVLRWRAAVAIAIAIILPLAIWLRPSSVIDRLETWADLIGKLTVFGHGLGSYASGAPMLAEMARKTHANNDLLEIAYEAGAVGVILAVGFVAALLSRENFGKTLPAALIVVVFLVEGLFGFPLHLPATAGLFALAAGHLARGGVKCKTTI